MHIRIILRTTSQFKLRIFFWYQNYPKRVFPVKNSKSESHHWILYIWISLDMKFQLKLTILIFWTKFTQKVYFQSKKEKVNITIDFYTFKWLWVLNFSLDWQFWFFGTNLPKKGISGQKFHWILHIWINLDIKLCSKNQFWILGPNLPKKGITVKNGKKEHHHWILQFELV